MKIFFDTEFIDNGKTIELISIGLVREDGETYYAEPEETDLSRVDDWLRDNVVPFLCGPRKPRSLIASEIREFVGATPEFWAYYCSYDWVALCQLYGPMLSIPKNWPLFCRDLRALRDWLGNPELIQQTGIAHNALTDAQWVKIAFDDLMQRPKD